MKKEKKNHLSYILMVVPVLVFSLLAIHWFFSREQREEVYAGAVKEVLYPNGKEYKDDPLGPMNLREQNPLDKKFIQALNNFSYETSVQVFEKEGENINYSPISLFYAISLATSGAKGDTEEELLEILGVSDIKFLSSQCGNLYRLLYNNHEVGKLKIANSIWLDNKINKRPVKFKEDFVNQAVENFYASSHSVNFSGKNTGKAIGQWISTNTNGTLVPSIKVNKDQIISLLNTIYFYGQWIDRFEKKDTAEDVFHLSNGKDIKCEFMNQQIFSSSFAKGEGFTRAGKFLKNGQEMIFILPDEGVSLYDLLSSSEKMKGTFEGGEEIVGEVVWKMPKFSFDSKLTMTDELKKLGINSAFTMGADFSKITDQPVYISNVSQETHIAIDEIGVTAAAFTQIDYCGSSVPKGRADMILNRPFIYGIKLSYPLDNGLLFVGICENPGELLK